MKFKSLVVAGGVAALFGLLYLLRPHPINVQRSGSSATSSTAIKLPQITAPVAGIKSVPPPLRTETKPDAFANFSNWAAEFTNGAVSLVDGERLAWKRREAMLDLIEHDPKRAIELSVPFELRQQLPSQITKFFEEQIDGRGNLDVLAATDFERSATTISRKVQLGERRFDAFVYGRRGRQVSRENIPLHGVALDGKLAVAEASLRLLSTAEATALDKEATAADAICSVSGQSATARGQRVFAQGGNGVLHFCGVDHLDAANAQLALAESGGTSAGSNPIYPSASDIAWTHGNKSLLYIRVNFPDDLTEPISEPAAYSAMNGVNTFYTENSYDLTSLTATVTPVITMPQTKAYYSPDPGLLLNDARAWAKKAGFVTANYDRDIVALTGVPGYTWGGLAAVGGKGTWLQSMGVGVTSHELGHNYGLWHANFWDTLTNYSRIGSGTNLEYGNIYDTMGPAAAGNALFNAIHKNLLDWLKADAVQTITSNGVYRIYPFDVADSRRVAGRMYAAALRKDSLRDYWLEFRQKYTANPWLENGLLVSWTPWDESNGGAQIIDTTPGSPAGDDASRTDAAVVIGRTYDDNEAGVHVTPLIRGSAGTEPWIEYQVNLGTFPSNHPPELTLEVDQPLQLTNSLAHFHAAASDPDGDTLAYSWTFDDLTFSTNNQPWMFKNFSAGDHVVRCVASDMKGGVASANVVVTLGASSGFRLSGRITDTNGAPLEGVLVGNGEISPDQFVGGWTDSNGRYVIVNVDGSTNVLLKAHLYGWTFETSTNWSSPYQPSNNVMDLDFIATALPTVDVVADTNVVSESDGSAHTFTVTRTGDTNADLVVRIVPMNTSSSATRGADYSMDVNLSTTNSLTIPAGASNVTFTIHVNNDNTIEGPENIVLTLLSDPSRARQDYVLAPPAEAIITIRDDDSAALPVVSVTTSTPGISEGGTDLGQITFTRSGVPGGDLFVNYSVSGTATAGADYVALPGVAVIPAGQSRVTIPLTVVDDKNLESDETVIVTVSPNAAYSVGSPSSATVKILDDDVMTVTVAAVADAAEPSTGGTFTVKRDGDLTEALVVNYSVSGTATAGTDFTSLSGTVTIPAGAASANITVSPINDAILEGDETVVLTLLNSVNYDVGTPGTARVFIRDDERDNVTITVAGSPVNEQGTTTATFTFTRNSTVGDLVVQYALSGTATPGADYVPLDNPVIIPDGSSSATLEVIPFHDLILEPDETVTITLPTNANYNASSSASATVVITDDSTTTVPGVGFCYAASAYPENESPGIAVALTTNLGVPVTVQYRVLGGTAPTNRYSLSTGTLTIPTNALVGFVPLQIVNDTVVQLPQTVRVAIFNPSNATLDAIKIHTYTILDNDACSVSVTATAASANETGPVAGNFRIARSGATNASQLVNFQVTGSASAPNDYAPLGSSVVIPAGATFVDLPVTVSDDNTMEFSQTVVLTLTSATNASVVSPNVATVTIGDNDTNNLPVVTITSTNHPFAYEGGGNGEFLFTRSGPATNSLLIFFTVGGTANNGVDYGAFTNTVLIPVGQSSVILPVFAVDDSAVEGDETVILSLTEGTNYRTAYPAFAKVTIQDNDQVVGIDASDFAASKYGPDPGEFTFTRYGTTNTPVTIFYSITGLASNGWDYARITNSILIPAGGLQSELPITPQHTGVPRGPLPVTLTLLPNVAYGIGSPPAATVVIDDDMPMLTLTGVVTNVLEGSVTNIVFRLTRTGDPQYDFMAYLTAGGSAIYNVDYAGFPLAVYFSCGVMVIDLPFPTFNNAIADGNDTVTADLVPNPAYTILYPSNALAVIRDAGNLPTPNVQITRPSADVVFLMQTNRGLIVHATVTGANSNGLAWTEENGLGARFDTTNTVDAAVLFTNAGVYRLRLTATNDALESYDEITVVVGPASLIPTGLLAWPLDEGTGTNVLDTTLLGHDGVLTGNPSWVTNGALGNALSFPGAGDCVRQSAGGNVLEGRKAFSLSMWLRSTTTNLDQGIFTASDGAGETLSIASRSHASCGNYTNVLEATLATTKGVQHRMTINNAAATHEWRHFVLTWSNGVAPQIYLDGHLDQPFSQWVTLNGTLTNCPGFFAGKGPNPPSWNGLMDDVRLFPGVLTTNEILALSGIAPGNTNGNHAPLVDAGTNQTVQINLPVMLSGTSSDDGQPIPPGVLTNTWEQLYTNTVTIPDVNSLTNVLVFTDPGENIFRLTADDGDIAVFHEVTITSILPTRVDISADIPDAYELGPVNGSFTLTRDGDTNSELTVYLAISGTASNSLDYVTFTNVVTFASGSNSISLPVPPFLDYAIEGDESVVATLLTNLAYTIGNNPATVTIHDSPYGLWSIAHFTLEQLTIPSLSGPGADFDHDGTVNFAEYALNLDPAVYNAPPGHAWGLETNSADQQPHLTFTWTRRLPPRDVEYGVFTSTNLVDWSTNLTEEFFRTNDPNGITETVKTRAVPPFPGTNTFYMRLRMWLQQVPGP